MSRPPTLLMATACAVSVANIYYNQPLLAQMGRDLHSPQIAYVPMYSQIGVGAGMFLFVPLGDMFERRRLIVLVSCASALAAVATALAPSMFWLAVASLLVGLMNIVPHLILPFAAQLSSDQDRGRVVGKVLSGLLIGILLARTVSGTMAAMFGWRPVYWFAAVLMGALAVALGTLLPKSQTSGQLTYVQLMKSIVTLVREQPLLREASLTGALLFGAFSAFWATLIFRLATPPFHYGSTVAGLFGIVGLAGALAAPIAGRIADRRNPRYAVGVSVVVTAVSYVIFLALGNRIWGLVIGVILLDLGVQAGHAANQTRIYRLIPDARSRLNMVYMVSYFAGGALGSALGAYGWSVAGWTGVCCSGLAMMGAALAIQYFKMKSDV